jgi:hypothetical protein
MTSRRTSADQHKARRSSPQRIIFTVIGLLVIFAFILGMLSY